MLPFGRGRSAENEVIVGLAIAVERGSDTAEQDQDGKDNRY
jgi:hypothetical protein